MWNRREISASSYDDQSHYLHPHPYVARLRAARTIAAQGSVALGRVFLRGNPVADGELPAASDVDIYAAWWGCVEVLGISTDMSPPPSLRQ
jgi:hypothetical protein